MKRRGRDRGFTLIELLVAIAIISLVIGILLPALGKTRLCSRLYSVTPVIRNASFGTNGFGQDSAGAEIQVPVVKGEPATEEKAQPSPATAKPRSTESNGGQRPASGPPGSAATKPVFAVTWQHVALAGIGVVTLVIGGVLTLFLRFFNAAMKGWVARTFGYNPKTGKVEAQTEPGIVELSAARQEQILSLRSELAQERERARQAESRAVRAEAELALALAQSTATSGRGASKRERDLIAQNNALKVEKNEMELRLLEQIRKLEVQNTALERDGVHHWEANKQLRDDVEYLKMQLQRTIQTAEYISRRQLESDLGTLQPEATAGLADFASKPEGPGAS